MSAANSNIPIVITSVNKMMQKKLELSRNAESASKKDVESDELVRLRLELKKVGDDRNSMSKKNEQLLLMCKQLNETVKNLENEKKKMQNDFDEKEKNKNNLFERYNQINFLGGGAYGKVYLVEDKQVENQGICHRLY